jgi:repressor LexA
MSELPSKKQRELLSFIDGFIKGNGYGPSYREIMRALDYKSVSTVAIHINGLIARGYLYKRDHSARSLEVVTSDNRGKDVEKSSDNVGHASWLAGVVAEKTKAYKNAPSAPMLREIRILIDALEVLGCRDEVTAAHTKLAKIIEP